MKTIVLTERYVTQVDDSDYERLMVEPKWRVHVHKRKNGSTKAVYCVRKVTENGKRTDQQMHRFILGITDPNIKVDHADHNGLNNQRRNLRPATDAENSRNQCMPSNNTSGFKGVSWAKDRQRWRAQIAVEGKGKHFGYFDSVQEAARAYDIAALKLHGQFAYTNTMREAA